jgi:hypothetical protein
VAVPYISRDVEKNLDLALTARQPVPVLVVGHSMAGKTRLAAFRVQTLFPDAPLLVPASGKALRQLVDAGLEVTGTILWLDDLERFIRGDDALDSGLLDRLVAARAVIVATIRTNELEPYRSRNEKRPVEWDVLSRFHQVPLQRRLTDRELDEVKATIEDQKVLDAVSRYGLAEYVGAGPDAVSRFDSGETLCPVGHAFIRAAVDWRRAGLARLVPFSILEDSLPQYLEGRDDVVRDADAIEQALSWATEKINETVALLLPYHATEARIEDSRLFEAFDYLVDTIAQRQVPIPALMWKLVTEAASAAETADVARVAGWYFTGRAKVMGELVAWLTESSSAGKSQLLVITGAPGAGKSAVLARLVTLADPAVRPLLQRDELQPRLQLPTGLIDIVIFARGKTARQVLCDIAEVAGVDKMWGPLRDNPIVPFEELNYALRDGLRKRARPLTIVLDALDETREPEHIARLLVDISHDARVVVGTRKIFMNALSGARVIDLDDSQYSDLHDINLYIRNYLLRAPNSPYRDRPELVQAAAAAITNRAGSSFLYAKVACEALIERGEPLDSAQEELLPNSIDDYLSATLSRLGSDRRRAEDLLAALAFSQTGGLTRDRWLEGANRLGRRRYAQVDLEWLLASPARSLITASAQDPPVYYLFHAVIRDYILRSWHDRPTKIQPGDV